MQKPTQTVEEYLSKLEHPLKAELNVLRATIKNADSRLAERIKWNAPSYFIHDDLLTFNLHLAKQIRLVLHHPAIVKVQSQILEGNYPDRRLIYFNSAEEVESKKPELERILKEYIHLANQK
jgi:uncharacterized protein YdhG (YjbR/CyaY superfamily)